MLQLLANVVADQWVNRRESYTIHSAHVNLERERIKTKLISAAGQPGWDGVVAADIIGGDAHADGIDQRRGGEYERYHVARGIATTLLMHSFGGATRLGALPAELRLGTVAPNVGPEYVSEILESLEQNLWYVHREGDLLKFQTRPNIYRMIARSAEEQSAVEVTRRLEEMLGKVTGGAEGFRVLEWAGRDSSIADRPELSVAVLEPRYAVVGQDGGPPAGADAIGQLWDRSGGGLRRWRNALILVAPDADLWSRAEEAMREVMAYDAVIQQVEKSANRTFEVSAAELRDLKARAKDKQDSLRTSIVTAYAWVFYPDADGRLSALKLPVPAVKNESIVTRAVDHLSDQDYGQAKILRRMGAVYFNAKLAPQVWRDEGSPLELGELSRRFLEWTYLPILPDREATLRACVREGIDQKLWAVAIGDNATATYQALIDGKEALDQLQTLFDGSASLVKGDLLDLIRENLGAKPEPQSVEPPTPVDEHQRTTERGSRIGAGSAPPIPKPQRLGRVRLRLEGFGIAKTSNLQPYLFKVLQEQDALATVTLTIDVDSAAGIPADVLERRIIEAFDQLGISAR